MILPVLFAQPTQPDDRNVSLDDERLKDEIPKGLQKVELDLDDALFLEFEEEEAPQQEALPESDAENAPDDDTEQGKERARHHGLPLWKKASFLGVILVIVLIAVAAIFWFLPGSDPESEDISAQKNAAKKPVSAIKPVVPTGGGGTGNGGGVGGLRKTYAFKPFVIERGTGKDTRFLTVNISIPGASPALTREITAKNVVLRDAIFRFLQKTDIIDPGDPEQTRQFTTDLTAALNAALDGAQAQKILIEGYVVK